MKYPNKQFFIKDTYDTLEWLEKDIPKPSDEELKEYWEEIKEEYFKENMRQKRNQLLQESDFRVVSDYPQRDKWIVYREKLRNLPSIWVEGTPFPSPPE
jgi:ribosomal protein L29